MAGDCSALEPKVLAQSQVFENNISTRAKNVEQLPKAQRQQSEHGQHLYQNPIGTKLARWMKLGGYFGERQVDRDLRAIDPAHEPHPIWDRVVDYFERSLRS